MAAKRRTTKPKAKAEELDVLERLCRFKGYDPKDIEGADITRDDVYLNHTTLGSVRIDLNELPPALAMALAKLRDEQQGETEDAS